jgi:hypothetical protein
MMGATTFGQARLRAGPPPPKRYNSDRVPICAGVGDFMSFDCTDVALRPGGHVVAVGICGFQLLWESLWPYENCS